MMGCGLEAPAQGAKPWQPPAPPISKRGYRHKLPTVCAGYLTRLPEVVEIMRAHAWAKEMHSLSAFLGGEQPSELLLLGIEIVDGEMSQVQTYALTDKKDGGGRE